MQGELTKAGAISKYKSVLAVLAGITGIAFVSQLVYNWYNRNPKDNKSTQTAEDSMNGEQSDPDKNDDTEHG